MDEDLESSISIETKRRLSKNRKRLEDYCPFDLPGITKLKLSPITQKTIGCVVGDEISAESPWVLVKKNRIVENIEQNLDNSEFFLLREKIHEYGEAEIYIGWIPAVSEIEDFFYVVFTSEAKEKVEKITQRQKADLQRRVDKLIFRPIRPWKSLGSEMEVDGHLVRNFRPLYEVQLKTNFPLRDTKVSFKLKTVEEIKDGYVELLPDERFAPELIKKRRVDVAVQVIPKKTSVEAQTTSPYPNNIWTQYKYEYTPPKLEDDEPEEELQDKRKQQKIKKVYPLFKTEYMITTVDELGEHIKVNNFFNIYQDDYADLVLNRRMPTNSLGDIRTIASFSAQQVCRTKCVSSISWDPFRSGVMCVSYADTTLNLVTNKQSLADPVLATLFGYCPVLIWSNTDSISPKLCLETPRPITCLSFCPYEKYILVGGCANGQVVIWNLKEKLNEAENIEKSTPKQDKYKMSLLGILKWNQDIYSKTLIKPVIISPQRNSHKDMITSINWMPRNAQMSSEGRLNYDRVRSRQFLTCSLDGTVSFWDIDSREKIPSAKRRKNDTPKPNISRFKTRPVILNRSTHKVERLDTPIYKMDLHGKEIFPVSSMLEICDELKFKPTGTSFDSDPKVRTEFELEETQNVVEKIQFFFTSVLGKITQAEMVEIDDLDIENGGTERLILKSFASVHNGPIILCQPHPIFKENFLTIGGSVFAVWNKSLSDPLLWIKASSTNNYISGGWAERNPSYFVLVCSDQSCELWDLLNTNNKPTKVIPFGNISSLFGTTNSGHSRKDTFAISDNLGTVTVLTVPAILKSFEKEKVLRTQSYFESAIARRDVLKKWMEHFGKTLKREPIKKHSFRDRVVKSAIFSRSASTRMTDIERMDRIFIGVEWSSLQEEAIFKTMLKLKNLNLTELEEYKSPLQEKALEKKERERKKESMLAQKQKIIKNAEVSVLPNVEFGKERKFSLPAIKIEDDFSYIQDYDEIENRALNFIKCNEYKPEFSFNQMVENARIQRQKNATILKQMNVHKRHEIRKTMDPIQLGTV